MKDVVITCTVILIDWQSPFLAFLFALFPCVPTVFAVEASFAFAIFSYNELEYETFYLHMLASTIAPETKNKIQINTHSAKKKYEISGKFRFNPKRLKHDSLKEKDAINNTKLVLTVSDNSLSRK